MNILIIDDCLPFAKAKADSTQKTIFCRLLEENFARRIRLARAFASLGANVLFARAEVCSQKFPPVFEFSESGGISQFFVRVQSFSKGLKINFPELISFGSLIADNSASIAGLFRPDVVIAGGVFPFSAFAAAKIAEGANSVLISEFVSSPKGIARRLGLVSPLSPVLITLKRLTECALRKSDAVLGLFPDAQRCFSGTRGLYPMNCPAPLMPKEPSETAKRQKEILETFREGETFVLAFPDPPEDGRSIEELITVCREFENKFALVFLSEGVKKPQYKKFAAEKGATNVFFMDGVLKKDLPFVLSGANGVFLSESEIIKGLSSESEDFLSALSAGIPAVACCEKNADFFRKSGGTIITKPRNKDSIFLGIKTLMEMSENDRRILGSSCKNFALQNSFENFAKDYLNLIDNLVNQKEIKK